MNNILQTNKAYKRVIELNLTNLEPWFFFNSQQIEVRLKGLRERYPSRKLIPFARRADNDDVACFDEVDDEKVFLIHDFASEGFEQRKIYSNFWEWFKVAIDDMILFE